mgnify:CR=1 FL=1
MNNTILAKESIAIGVAKKNEALLETINNSIEEYKESGKLDTILKNWLGDNSSPAAYDLSSYPQNNHTDVLKVGVAAIIEPMCFVMDNAPRGADTELIENIAFDMGKKVEYYDMSFASLIPALESGKVDVIISNITATEERSQIINFSTSYYDDPQIVLMRREADSSSSPDDPEQLLSGTTVGAMTGSTSIRVLNQNYPDATILEFDSIGDAVEALKANKLDHVVTAYSTAKNFEKNNPELKVLDSILSTEEIAIGIAKENEELLNEVNGYLDKYFSDGTLDRIMLNWFGDSSTSAAYDTSNYPANEYTDVLKVGIAANREPMCFIMDGKPHGVDIELIENIAYEMGMKIEYQDMNFSSLIPSLQSGKIDVAISNITATDERREIINFSTPYFDNPQVIITQKSKTVSSAENRSSIEQFISNLGASFERTFITENRWKLILSGLGVTLVISLGAFILGSLFGGLICAMLRSEKKIALVPARIYVRLLQGTPIVVLLMILYYVIFRSVDISAIVVAIIGFALNTGAYTSEIFRTAINGVDKGQIEAALAIGFNKFQVFMKIILPQAARSALPVYKGEFISLVKSTSIVGYIAIQDLTKASDIIRSRTYEAFFPLITTAIIYFVVTYIFIMLLNAIEKKIDPKHRKRTLKGVDCK